MVDYTGSSGNVTLTTCNNWTSNSTGNAMLGHHDRLGGPNASWSERELQAWADSNFPDGTPRPVDQRDAATLATSVLAVLAGVWGIRVHDVAATVDAIRVCQEMEAHR